MIEDEAHDTLENSVEYQDSNVLLKNVHLMRLPFKRFSNKNILVSNRNYLQLISLISYEFN